MSFRAFTVSREFHNFPITIDNCLNLFKTMIKDQFHLGSLNKKNSE